MEFSLFQKAVQANDMKDIPESCMYLYENAGEILAECADSELRLKISRCICSMMKEIEALRE